MTPENKTGVARRFRAEHPEFMKPRWTYAARRASLECDGRFFAIITLNGTNELPETEVAKLLADLNAAELCQQKLLALQSAIDEHTTEMDALMRQPASLDRGRAIGNLTNLLAQARRESELNCPPLPITAASPSEVTKRTKPTVSSSSTAVSTRRPRKRKPR